MRCVARACALACTAFLLAFINLPVANAEAGVVALRVSGCDYYLIYKNGEYVLAEWYGGYDPMKGELVVGSFNSYGFKTFFFGPAHAEGRVYVEDYSLSEDDAMEQISDNCQ